jgi:hypothetical protein
MVEKELWVSLLAYNLIRLLMAQAAHTAGLATLVTFAVPMVPAPLVIVHVCVGGGMGCVRTATA